MSKPMSEEERKAWDANPNTTLTVGGKSFFCECGCNVFGHVNYDKNHYVCNSCNTKFKAG